MSLTGPGVSLTTLRRFVARQAPERDARIIWWGTATSNVDFPTHVTGHGIRCLDNKGEPIVILCDVYRLDSGLIHPVDCAYLIDDGRDVTPFFVASWCLYDRSLPGPATCDADLPAGYIRLRKQRPTAPHRIRGPRQLWHLSVSPTGD